MATEYIRKEDALNALEIEPVVWDGDDEFSSGCSVQRDIDIEAIKSIKPADVAPVVHAYWYIVEYEYLICSECEGQYHTGCETTPEAEKMLEEGLCPSYCPHCGAKMDKPVPKKSRRKKNIH